MEEVFATKHRMPRWMNDDDLPEQPIELNKEQFIEEMEYRNWYKLMYGIDPYPETFLVQHIKF